MPFLIFVQTNFGIQFNSFGDAFNEEFHAIMSALKYVLKSYVLLPVNLWKTGIMFMARMWDRYVVGASVMGKARMTFADILG